MRRSIPLAIVEPSSKTIGWCFGIRRTVNSLRVLPRHALDDPALTTHRKQWLGNQLMAIATQVLFLCRFQATATSQHHLLPAARTRLCRPKETAESLQLRHSQSASGDVHASRPNMSFSSLAQRTLYLDFVREYLMLNGVLDAAGKPSTAIARKLPKLKKTYWLLAGRGDLTGDLLTPAVIQGLTPAGVVKALRTSAGQWPQDLFDLAELQA